MGYNIKNITDEDIRKVLNCEFTVEELSKAFDLATEKLETKIKGNNPLWDKMCITLYAYKLGEMQGKRAERAKKRRLLHS